MTRLGEQTCDIPQVRGGGCYPSAREGLAYRAGAQPGAGRDVCAGGGSTRKVCNILVKLLRPEVSISSTQVSSAAEKLDARLAAWREGGQLVDCAVLVAVGVTQDGKRRVLGVSVALSEAEVHWLALRVSGAARRANGDGQRNRPGVDRP